MFHLSEQFLHGSMVIVEGNKILIPVFEVGWGEGHASLGLEDMFI